MVEVPASESSRLIRVARGGRYADHLAPGAEGGVACGTVLVGSQAAAAEFKVVVDPAVGRESALC